MGHIVCAAAAERSLLQQRPDSSMSKKCTELSRALLAVILLEGLLARGTAVMQEDTAGFLSLYVVYYVWQHAVFTKYLLLVPQKTCFVSLQVAGRFKLYSQDLNCCEKSDGMNAMQSPEGEKMEPKLLLS